MKLEDAKKKLKEDIQSCKDMMQIKEDTDCEYYKNKIKNWNTILDYLDNSISTYKVKERIKEIDLKINNLKIEINKTLRANEEAGTETEIDTNEQYLERLEIELERLEITKRILQELLEDK